MCAERVALFKALSSGTTQFVHLACSTGNGGPSCGACRQLLAEYCPEDMECIFTAGPHGDIIRRLTVAELCPDPFVLEKVAAVPLH